jgi:hypothetical protein
MTKTVNSISLRLGYNIFWLHKKSNVFTFFTFNSLFVFFQKEFRKKLIVCFKMKLSIDEILLNVYNLSIKHRECLKLDKLNWEFLVVNNPKYKKKYNKVINYLILIKKININNYYIYNYTDYIYKIFTLYSKFENWGYKIIFYKFLLFILSVIIFFCNNSNKTIEFFIKCYYLKNFCLINKYINMNNLNHSVNLKKKILVNKVEKIIIFHHLQFKFLGVIFENLLIYYYVRFFKVSVNSIMNNLSLDFFFFLTKYNQHLMNLILKSRNRKLYFWLYLFFYLQNIELFTRWIGSLLSKTYQHRKKIRFFIQIIHFLFTKKLINFKGFKIYISGKLNGKMKRSKYGYKMGEIWLNTFNNKINYYYLPLYTKFGIFSLKVWLII